MLTKLLLVLLVCGVVTCSITCPDRRIKCRDQETCCFTQEGYRCCPYPNAVCCADQAHCCPFGYMCNQVSKMCVRQWDHRPLGPREEAAVTVKLAPLQEKQSQASPSVVHCDSYYTCPDGTTCCRHPGGGYTCCPYSPARCCLDGYHCCPYGYDCDYTYTHCIRQGVPYPFSSYKPSGLPADPVPNLLTSSGALAQPTQRILEIKVEEPAVREGGVIHCDSQFYCPKGSSCCQNQKKEWSCCPNPLGVCCADGTHCCAYGYTCDPTSKVCRRSLKASSTSTN